MQPIIVAIVLVALALLWPPGPPGMPAAIPPPPYIHIGRN